MYGDEARSGSNTEREQFRQLIQAAGAGEFKVIVFYDQSRRSRNVVDWFQFRDQMRTLGVRVCSCTETMGDISDPSAFLSEGVKAIINQHFLLECRAKVISGQTAAAKRGVFLGGVPPLGYDIVDCQYVINDYEADAVRLIFVLYAQGDSYGDILNAVQSKGYKGKRGAPLGENSLYSILRNERYIGVYTWNKQRVKYLKKWAGGGANHNLVRIEGCIPPIIDNETWEVVQMRATNSQRNSEHKAKREYMLTGLVFCSKCGGAMVGISNSRAAYYVCGNKHRTRTCDLHNISTNDIEVLVYNLLQDSLRSGELAEYTADIIIDEGGSIGNDTAKLQKEIENCDRRINNLLNAVAEGTPYAAVQTAIETDQNKKAALTEKVKAASQIKLSRETVVERVQKEIDQYVGEHNKPRELVRKYIDRIDIGDEEISISTAAECMHTTGCGTRI